MGKTGTQGDKQNFQRPVSLCLFVFFLIFFFFCLTFLVCHNNQGNADASNPVRCLTECEEEPLEDEEEDVDKSSVFCFFNDLWMVLIFGFVLSLLTCQRIRWALRSFF